MMNRNPEGAPQPLPKEPGPVRKAFKSARRIGLRAAATSLVAGGVITEATIPQAVASPDNAATIVRSTPIPASITEQFPDAQIPQSVADSLTAKRKPRDGEQASGKTSAKEQAEIETRQLKELAAQIAKTENLTQEQFEAWVYTIGADGRTNEMSISEGAHPVTYINDFPLEFNDDPSSIRPMDFVEENGISYLTYSYYGTRVPQVPHTGFLFRNQDRGTWDTLGFLDGLVTIDLPEEKGGSATIAAITSLWPNGEKITQLVVVNVEAPNNPALGPDQSTLTDTPLVNHTPDRIKVSPALIKGQYVDRESFFAELGENKGKPISIFYTSNILLSESPRFKADGSLMDFGLDASLTEIEPNQFLPILNALGDAYFKQDTQAFAVARKAGEDAGVFLPATTDAKGTRKALKTALSGITDLESLFAHVPFVEITFVTGATAPAELSSGSESATVAQSKISVKK